MTQPTEVGAEQVNLCVPSAGRERWKASDVQDIPDDFRPGPIGQRGDLIRAIAEVVPSADFSDPSWGIIDGHGFSIEASIGSDETVDCIALFVRGGDIAAGVVLDIVGRLGLRALDTGTGDFFNPATAVESLRRWRSYRDRAIGHPGR
jgi:hypothetical protein